MTGEGEPLLLVHGIGRSLEDWNEQHERLAQRHTVYSLDLPGFGYSERMPGRATLDTLAAVLPALPRCGRHHAADTRRSATRSAAPWR